MSFYLCIEIQICVPFLILARMSTGWHVSFETPFGQLHVDPAKHDQAEGMAERPPKAFARPFSDACDERCMNA